MVLGVAMLATIVAGVGSTLQRPTYVADATLRLATITTTAGGGLRPDVEYSDRVASTYAGLVATTPVLDEVRERLQLAEAPVLEAWVPASSELIRVRAHARTGQ